MGRVERAFHPDLPVLGGGVLADLHERLKSLIVAGNRSASERETVKDLLKNHASNVAPSLLARCSGAKRMLVVGCGTDFDECCQPIITALRATNVDVHIRCYWVDLAVGASAYGSDIALVSQDYSDGDGKYDLALVVTAITPADAFLEALLIRLIEADRPRAIILAPYFIARSTSSFIATNFRNVVLAVDQAQVLPEGPEAISFYRGLSGLLALPRRHFRHMPQSIEAELTGRDYKPENSLFP